MTIPEAIDAAKQRLIEVMPELSEGTLQLEELETPPQDSRWKFTFSAIFPFSSDDKNPAGLYELMRGRRLSKLVEIEKDNGSLIAVRNAAA